MSEVGFLVKGFMKIYVNLVCVFDGVSLDVQFGLYGLFGFNGVGKSMLMCIFVMLQQFDDGSIVFDGVDVFVNLDYLWQCFGYLF